jgi:1-acyl-sn-glycerol-3-phosphate acyltransferase
MRKFLDKPIKDDLISKFGFNCIKNLGWKIQEPPGEEKTYVYIAYPHTTNLDTILSIFTAFTWGRSSFVLVKESYDKPVLKDIMKLFRMLPIQRSAEGAKYAQEYYERLKASIGLVPEGTRKKADGWKKGFHWFAKNNNLDIVLMHLNYETKVIGWDAIITPGETPDETLQKCKDVYEKTNPIGLYPELASPIKWA